MSLMSADRPTGSSLGEQAVGQTASTGDDFEYAVFAAKRPAASGPTGGTFPVVNPALAAALGQFHRAFEQHRPQTMFILSAVADLRAVVTADEQKPAALGDRDEFEDFKQAVPAAAAGQSWISSLDWVVTRGSVVRSIDFVVSTNVARLVGSGALGTSGRALDSALARALSASGSDDGGDGAGRVDDAVATVAALSAQLGVKPDDVLVAAGVKRRTFYSWKQTSGRRPRVGSQARLWELAEHTRDLAEQLGDTPVRAWMLADTARRKLLLAGAFDELVALVTGEQLAAHRAAGGQSYGQVDSPYGVGPSDGTPLPRVARAGPLILDDSSDTDVHLPPRKGRDGVR